MIDHIEGKIIERKESALILAQGGIGYRVQTSRKTLEETLGLGDSARLYTSLQVRENELALFGFSTASERELFDLLLTISGVGPKVAISILSSVTPERLQEAVVSKNPGNLSGIKGVGKKTAERLVMELQGKIEKVAIERRAPSMRTGHEETALRALTQNLGFGERESRRALEIVLQENGDLPAEELIRRSLTYLSKR